MIIQKITQGYVIQTYDTKTKRWIRQEFTADGHCNYEDDMGNTVDASSMMKQGEPEPYLPFDMVQPRKNFAT